MALFTNLDSQPAATSLPGWVLRWLVRLLYSWEVFVVRVRVAASAYSGGAAAAREGFWELKDVTKDATGLATGRAGGERRGVAGALSPAPSASSPEGASVPGSGWPPAGASAPAPAPAPARAPSGESAASAGSAPSGEPPSAGAPPSTTAAVSSGLRMSGVGRFGLCHLGMVSTSACVCASTSFRKGVGGGRQVGTRKGSSVRGGVPV